MLREVPIIVISALVVAVIIKTFFIHFFYVPSGSMQNTLGIGDRIAVNKFSAMFSDIRRGEVPVGIGRRGAGAVQIHVAHGCRNVKC